VELMVVVVVVVILKWAVLARYNSNVLLKVFLLIFALNSINPNLSLKAKLNTAN
jgi:hypothetical protein